MERICIVIPYKYPVPAVLGGAVETLVQFLIEENEKNPIFEFTVLATYDNKLADVELSYRHTKFIYFKTYKYLDSIWEFIFRAIKKVFRVYVPFAPRFVSILDYLKREGKQYDYVLFENGLSYMLPLIAKVYPKEKILNHIHWPGDGNEKIDKSFAYLLSVSEFCAEEWKSVTHRSDNTIFVLENCYNDDFFKQRMNEEEKNALRRKLNISQKDNVIIYVGRVIPQKGIKELLLALQKSQTDNLVLILIGKANFGLNKTTAFEKEISSIISSSKVRVVQMGFVPNKELYKYYNISSLAVMPTFFEESAGMVNIEAMASGIPLISTNRGAVKEYVGDSAVVLDVDEKFVDTLACAIDDVLCDFEKKNVLIRSGLERAKKYTKQKYFESFVSIINNIDSNK